MTREEFYQKAVLELAGAMATQSGAWKVQLDKAVLMASYLTDITYGDKAIQARPEIEIVL
jgi:hypothetical protein